MARAIAKQTADRIDHLQGMILEGDFEPLVKSYKARFKT